MGNKFVKIIICIVMIISGFLLPGIAFTTPMGDHHINELLIILGFILMPLGIILLVFASISKAKKC